MVEIVKTKIFYGVAPCKFGINPVMLLRDMFELHGVTSNKSELSEITQDRLPQGSIFEPELQFMG
jgi:hypothetical protein